MFRFPKDEEIRKIWIQRCRRLDKFNPSSSYICSIHFDESDFQRDMKSELMGCPKRKRLKEHTVPHLKLPSSTSKFLKKEAQETNRTQRMREKELKKVINTWK